MFRNETHASNLINFAGKKLILFTKITELHFLPGNFSFQWLRPSAIWLVDESGHEQVVKISDPTRQILLSMFGLVAVGTTLLWLLKFTNLRSKKALSFPQEVNQ